MTLLKNDGALPLTQDRAEHSGVRSPRGRHGEPCRRMELRAGGPDHRRGHAPYAGDSDTVKTYIAGHVVAIAGGRQGCRRGHRLHRRAELSA